MKKECLSDQDFHPFPSNKSDSNSKQEEEEKERIPLTLFGLFWREGVNYFYGLLIETLKKSMTCDRSLPFNCGLPY